MAAALIVRLADPAACDAGLVGPKAARLARLAQAGLPVPAGVCLTADAYRLALQAAGLESAARAVARAAEPEARRQAVAVRLGLARTALPAALAEAPVDAWRALAGPGVPVAVRSSALLEDTPATSCAGQFETFLGIDGADDLLTAVRACWAALWAPRALRYLAARAVDPADLAMAVLIQHLVPARAAGGALSLTAEGTMLVTGAWGLGSAVAQGEVIPDRFVLSRTGRLERVEPGWKERLVRTAPGAGARAQAVAPDLVEAPCLPPAQAEALGRLVLGVEAALGAPVDVEWALGPEGLQVLQARPLRTAPSPAPDPGWLHHPGLAGQPAGLGWGEGAACVVGHEHELERVRPGEVLVTRVAGPALASVLGRVAAVVAERGGSTSHLAALARERGIPAVLGVPGATRRIPHGARVAVDGVRGLVRWIRRA